MMEKFSFAKSCLEFGRKGITDHFSRALAGLVWGWFWGGLEVAGADVHILSISVN